MIMQTAIDTIIVKEMADLGLMTLKTCSGTKCGLQPAYKFYSDHTRRLVSLCNTCRTKKYHINKIQRAYKRNHEKLQ